MRAHRFRQSSTIDRIAYEGETCTLSISFRDTGIYLYRDVPGIIFEAFCQTASAGRFFNEHIKNRFRCVRDPQRRRFGPNA